ncbi:glutamate dehydrogenase [Dokdonia sinensis]|uniref:Glutamate dehydrogenase n=1 Tax=Dokdonia sinensis TaxID=2479847 RepID=A0A3M0G2U2_9FLAO|nr:glutamate dehydrogenase [Dokdonia sinensis]RMB59085.1 glutamate dehydrogenase [Dokdonia sinensis]
MKAKYLPLAILMLFLTHTELKAQFGFSHEIGFITGPVAFQSDYGERSDFETNAGNVGFGIGIVHYLNFSYRADCNCYSRDTYFNDHFKVRNEIDYHVTNLNNFGPEASDDDFGGLKLRNHNGKAKVLELGTQLEYFPMSIRDFAAGVYKIAPYFSFGAHFVSYNPEISSDFENYNGLNSQVQNPNTGQFESVFFQGFLPGDGKFGGLDDSPGSTWAITFSTGIRYKLSAYSDLLLDARWHYYTSNWVDGLNPDPRPVNRANDWIFWLNVGYIYYLD